MSLADIIIIISLSVCIAALFCAKIIRRKHKKNETKGGCKDCPFCDDCQKYYVGCTEEDLHKTK